MKLKLHRLTSLYTAEHFFTALLWIFFLLFSLGQLQRIQLPRVGAFYLFDLVLAVMLLGAMWLTSFWKKALEGIKKGGLLEKVFGGWVLFTFFAGLVLQQYSPTSLLYVLRLSFYLTVIFGWWMLLREKRVAPTLFRNGFFLSGGLILWWGFLQYVLLPDTRFLFFLGWDDHFYRLISTLLDPGFTGAVFMLTYLWFVGSSDLHLVSPKLWNKRITWFISLFFVVGMLLTYSRATYLAWFSSMCVLIVGHVIQKSWHSVGAFLLTVLAFMAILPVLPRPGGEGVRLERLSTVGARTNTLTQGLQQLQPRDFVLGRGVFSTTSDAAPSVEEYAVPNHAKNPDNWVIFLLQGTGIPGLVLFGALVVKHTIRLWRKKKYWFVASTVALFIHGLFNASLFYPFTLLLFGGMVVTVCELHGRQLKKE